MLQNLLDRCISRCNNVESIQKAHSMAHIIPILVKIETHTQLIFWFNRNHKRFWFKKKSNADKENKRWLKWRN